MTVPHTAATPIATGAAPLRFFLLVLLLSVPFYILGATGFRLPGLTILPASALMTFMPMIAALILVQRERGAAAAIAMFKRALRPSPDHRIRWPLTALVFMPVVCLLEFGVLRLTGSAVPLPQIAPGAALLLFTGFMIGAIGEEVSWQGYAYPALRTRLSVLASSAFLGSIWALWHVVPFFQLGRSLEWIFWHSLSAVALRVIIVWLFESTRGKHSYRRPFSHHDQPVLGAVSGCGLLLQSARHVRDSGDRSGCDRLPLAAEQTIQLWLTCAFFAGRLAFYSDYSRTAKSINTTCVGAAFQKSLTSPMGIGLQIAMIAILIGLAQVDSDEKFKGDSN